MAADSRIPYKRHEQERKAAMSIFADKMTLGRRAFLKVTSLVSAGLVFSYRKIAWAADYLATRITAIYTRDSGLTLRKSQENSAVTALYTNFLGSPLGEMSESLLHTSYVNRSSAVEEETGVALPSPARIRSVSPNPFNNAATITVDLPSAGYSTVVIYSLSGQKVREFPSVTRSTGTHYLTWDGRTDSGRAVSSGVYIARLSAGGHASSMRMTLMK